MTEKAIHIKHLYIKYRYSEKFDLKFVCFSLNNV